MDAITAWKTTDGNTCSIYYDLDCSNDNPRNWDNLGRIIVPENCRYLKSEEDCPELSWDDKEADLKYLREKYIYVFPVFVLDHSAVKFSTEFINSPWGHWDCGQIGWIVIDENDLKYYSEKIDEKRALEIAEGELETLTQWANGEVYGYILTDPDGNELGSCWGYYSIEDIKSEYPEIEEAEA